MELTRTVILKLENPDDDLVNTMQRYSEGMNYASKIVYEQGRPMAAMKMQRKIYNYTERCWV